MRKSVGLILLLLWLMIPQVQAAGITITVNPESTVVGPSLALGDLAQITGEDTARVQALKIVKLGNAPTPGTKMGLTAEALGARLSASGADFTDVIWQVPSVISIATASQTLSGEMLATRAKEAVYERLSGSGTGSDTEVTLMGTPADLVAPLGKVELNVEFPYGIRFNAFTMAMVKVIVDGRPYTSVGVKCEVKAYQNVIVAARNLAYGEIITGDAIRLDRCEIGHLTGYVTDPEKVIGLSMRRPVVAGVPITDAVLIKPVIMQRNATITIMVKIGDIVIMTSGKALQQGREGDVIRVQNLSSQKILTAKVIDGTTVQVITYSGR